MPRLPASGCASQGQHGEQVLVVTTERDSGVITVCATCNCLFHLLECIAGGGTGASCPHEPWLEGRNTGFTSKSGGGGGAEGVQAREA